MEPPDKSFSELVDIFKSWIPRRAEPGNLSRDFWMPDHSCRVCYECDSQFTVFNRRHHCRLCGRVFCARCTANSIPTPCIDPKSHQEERERIRVCNYCFKQWEQDIVTVNNGTILCSPGLSPSKSLASAKSSFTGNSSCVFAPSIPYSTGDHQDVEHGSGLSSQSIQMGVSTENQDTMACGRNEDSVSDTRGPSQNEYGFCINRSDDEDDEYGSYRAESDTKCFQSPDDYYDQVKFDLIDNGYRSHKVHRPVERPDRNDLSSSTNEDPNSQVLLTAEKLGEDVEGHDFNGEECDAASSIYGVECTESETVDFENNGLLWLPPEPEVEEDEKEAVLFDDDDDEDATGEWKQLRSSSSFGSGEYRSITVRTTEEHQKVMKAVVEGHFRALVAQLLQVENLHMDEEDKESWLDIITSLSWEAATILKPDTSKGGGMDPGGYVKVKCIACGHRSESAVVKGVVCKKNVAHRHMTSKIKGPRFLILGGALEYQRVSNLLSSFDTLLQQEMDHLKMAVAKIDAHHPNVLLVEKSVSRFAQECLLAKDISLVLNVKRPLLERIARCTGAQIIPSVDLLSSQKLGHCETFHVEKYLEQHGSAGKGGKKLVKTLMFFEGCPKPLGCTILLKGANGDDLKIVKHVIQYGIFAAYHLALETSFLADEGASLPELPLKSPLTVALPDTSSSVDRSISMIPGFTTPTSSKQQTHSDIQQSNDVLKSKQPFSRMEDPMSLDTPKGLNSPIPKTTPVLSKLSSSLICDPKELLTIKDTDVPKYSEERHKDTVGVTDNNSLLHQDNNNLQEKQASEKEEFPPSPSDHQSILVSLSTRCVWKGTVCERAHLFRIKYYGNFDKPLGRFLGDHLFDQCYRCRSCDMPAEAHVHCYTHRQGSLTISVKKLLEFPLPGERDGKVWMWHRCLKCPRSNGFPPATRRIAMSDAAWGLSFGKFLELSFSNHAAASRVASCGHSLHRDCLRFYGFGNMVACFRYASIDVHSVYLPPHKLDFNLHNQEWIQKEANEVAERAKLLFNEVLNALGLIAVKHSGGSHNSGLKVSQSSHHIGELEAMLQRERAEFEEFLQRVVKKEPKKGQPLIDILEINRLHRQLLFHSYVWDQRLISATGLGSAQCKELTGRVTKCKEMPTSVEKLAEMNLPSKALSLTSPDTLTVNVKNTIAVKGILSSPDNQGGYKPDHYIGKLNSDLPESLEEYKPVRRALSEGQFPMVANLSETLDAAWTGEATPTCIRPQENSFALLDSFTLDSSTPLQCPAFILESERPCANPEDKGQVEVVHTPGSKLSVKVPDRVDDFTSWIGMPFLSFYRSFNKNSSSDSAKLNSFSEYNPVYVSSFQELVHQGGARLLLPVGINDTVVSVYDNEPTSIISYALVSLDYHFQMSDERERIKSGDFYSSLPLCDSASIHPFQTFDEITQDSLRSFGSADRLSFMSGSRSSLVDPLLYTNAMPVRVSFTDDSPLGKVKYMVTCYYAKGFEALRRICCPSELDFVRSLCRCKRWGAQGGKSNALFEKSLDDRFIIKQVTKTELESFAKFAPGYFKYLSESIGTGSPTCLAKILGIYQISSKHLKGGKESRIDVLVMENLMFGRKLTRVYDLKGSSRSRYNDCSGTNKVLLDQNLIEAMPTSPIFVGNKAKRLLERAVWNDTSFLASIDVMDYSLLVGVDEEKHELVLGIIDFIRQYTWDKHLETWVKASGILGGPKNSTPTVVSPKQYKKRFRKAMSAYFLMVPDQWFPPTIIPNHSQSDLKEENLQNISP